MNNIKHKIIAWKYWQSIKNNPFKVAVYYIWLFFDWLFRDCLNLPFIEKLFSKKLNISKVRK